MSQTEVKLKRAGFLAKVNIGKESVQRLKNDVWLVQGNTNIYCDSAYLNKETNSARAFGRVRIIDTVDPLHIESDYMEYDGNTRRAKLRNNVVMKDDSVTLYTDFLDYNRTTKTGNYFNGGRLIDSQNELQSQWGYYHTQTKQAEFFQKVTMTNPDFDLAADTLYYNTNTSLAKTKGKTIGITSDADTLRTNHGLIYNRQLQYAEVYRGNINGPDYFIEADTLITDDQKQLYNASRNIKLISKPDSLTIYGEKGFYNKLKKTSLVYDQAYLRKMMEGDSLFISADTLFSDQSDENNKYLTAYHQVKMFKSNMQGMADSVSYNFADSVIYMYTDPVIWVENSQIKADSINIEVRNNKIDKMNLRLNSFVISKDTLGNYNQVKGRDMEVYFNEGLISKTHVNGNGESIYYLKETSGAVSMNSMKCSNMALYFSQNTITEIRNYEQVDGQVKPEFEISRLDRRLRGFNWLGDEKPTLEQVARHLRYDR
tara:strand:- start:1844 stop:3298 length:1455 start_codon:yes stop_codon:yes gene_type:complete